MRTEAKDYDPNRPGYFYWGESVPQQPILDANCRHLTMGEYERQETRRLRRLCWLYSSRHALGRVVMPIVVVLHRLRLVNYESLCEWYWFRDEAAYAREEFGMNLAKLTRQFDRMKGKPEAVAPSWEGVE